MTGALDIVCNLFDPKAVRLRQTSLDDTFEAQVRLDKRYWRGIPVSQYLRKMDSAGIERSLLIGVRAGDLKLRGLADLTAAVRELEFVGAHLYPHWFDLAPDHAKYCPYYAKCAELDVSIMMQVGQNLVYSRDRRLANVARPILLDRVAIDFPELTLIGIHIGVPWTDEMISMCRKHPNVYTAGDGYAPKHWPAAFVHYANTYGRDKVLFGTDWPVINPECAVREVGELGLRPESERMLMRENALRIFRFPGRRKR